MCVSLTGSVELWTLAEDERLLMNKFTRDEHDDVVTSVSVTSGGQYAVSGSMDCRSAGGAVGLGWALLCVN